MDRNIDEDTDIDLDEDRVGDVDRDRCIFGYIDKNIEVDTGLKHI